MTWLAVFAGGALGSLVRAWLWAPDIGWTTGSVLANASAGLVIGVLYARRDTAFEHALAFGAVGFCGGLSTFSAFAADLAALLDGGDWWRAAVAAGTEIAIGIAAVVLGERLGRPRAGESAPRSAPRRGRR